MRYLRKFEKFVESIEMAEPAVKPSRPTTKPGVKPGTRPGRPTPIRRDKPSVDPAPKALKKAKAEDVANKFVEMASEEGFDFKKYFPNV